MRTLSRRSFLRAAIGALSLIALLLFEVPARLLRYWAAAEDPLITALAPGAARLEVIQRLATCEQCAPLAADSLEDLRTQLEHLPKNEVLEHEGWMLSGEEFSLWRRLGVR